MMHIPNPLPDEFSRGIRGRVGVINGLTHSKEVNSALRSYVGDAYGASKDDSPLVLLAHACNCEVGHFVRAHSLIPYLRGVTSLHPDRLHGDCKDLIILQSSGMRIDRNGAYLCPDCLKEDDAFWGFSYWRRIHQLPGIDYCIKHRRPLLHVSNNDAFDTPPDRWIYSATLLPTKMVTVAESSPVIRRYAEFLCGFLDRDRPFAARPFAYSLRANAKRAGINIAHPGKHPNLSDYALTCLPKGWLQAHFNEIASRATGTLFEALDGACWPTGSRRGTAVYALAAALIFESAEDGFHELSSAQETPLSAPESRPRRGTAFWGGDQVFRLYVKHRGNVRKIASSLGLAHRQVQEALNVNGWPGLGRIRDKTLCALKDFFDESSLERACDAHGANIEDVERILRTVGSRFCVALEKMEKRKFKPEKSSALVPTPKQRGRPSIEALSSARSKVKVS